MVNKYVPHSLNEALDILASNDVYIVAGGSDMMVQKKNTAGLAPKFDKDVLYLAHIDELKKVYKDDEGVHIGAGCHLSDLEHDKLVPELLRKCIGEVASVNIRHFATLAGNIANASPAGDTIVIDVLLDAVVVLQSKNGIRKVPAEDFVLGVRKIDRHQDELITEIVFPNKKYGVELWHKVGSRKADSISKLSFAGAYTIKDETITDFACAFGSVAIKVARCHELEAKIKGLKLAELAAQKESLIEQYSHVISPIDDQRSNKEYRQKVAMNILTSFLDEIIKGGRQ